MARPGWTFLRQVLAEDFGSRSSSTHVHIPRDRPLNVPLENLPSPRGAVLSRAQKTEVTALPNGVRVASEESAGHITAVSIFIDAGSRMEPPNAVGVSHFLERLAFKVGHCRPSDE